MAVAAISASGSAEAKGMDKAIVLVHGGFVENRAGKESTRSSRRTDTTSPSSKIRRHLSKQMSSLPRLRSALKRSQSSSSGIPTAAL